MLHPLKEEQSRNPVGFTKKLRWALFGAPGRLVRTARQTIVRVIDNWPGADMIVGAYQRITLIT